MDDQILIGILRRLRWLEAHAVHYRIAEDGTAVLTWRGSRSPLGAGGGGGDVFLASPNVFTADNIFSSAGPDTIKLTSATAPGITFGAAGDVALYRGAGTGGATPALITDDWFLSTRGLAVEEAANTRGFYVDGNTGGAGWGYAAVYFATADQATSYAFATASWTGADRNWAVRGDGRIEWGDGTNPLDTALYRYAANYLRTSGAFIADASLYVDFAGLGTRLYFGAAADVSLYRGGADQLSTDDLFTAGKGLVSGYDGAAGTLNGLYIYASGDSSARLSITNNGVISWGAGSGGVDTVLYRSAANVLKTDDDLIVGSNFQGLGTASVTGQLYLGGNIQHTTASVFNIYASSSGQDIEFQTNGGKVWVGRYSDNAELFSVTDSSGQVKIPITGSGAGLLIGGDTNLYRNAANELKTDDALTVAGLLKAHGSAWIDATGVGGALAFGAAADVSLYRGASDTLTTDDNFNVGGVLGVTGNTNIAGHVWVDTDGSGSKLYFGSAADVSLYRSFANALQTDDYFIAGNGLVQISGSATPELRLIPSSGAQANLAMNTSGTMILSELGVGDRFYWDIDNGHFRLAMDAGQITFGASQDTNLYRSGANALKTDDSFECASFSTGQGFMEIDAGAIGGSSGTPSSTNRYVTMDDGVWDVLGGGEIRPGTSDIAHDASSNVAAGTGDLSWTHTPVGVPGGVVVQIVQNVGINDEVISVTYGGVAMNPIHQYTSYVLGSEPGAIYSYFLGFDIPAGPVTVAVDVDGTASSKRAVCHTVTSGKPVRACLATSTEHSGAADPSATLALPTYMESAVYGALHSGQDDVSAITAGANYTEVLEHDFGTQTASWIRRTSNTTGGDTAVNWTVASESYKAIGVALTQVQARDYGRAETLPSRGTIGDRVSVAVDDPINPGRTIWEFVFESYLGGASDWHFIGGSSLRHFSSTARTRAVNSYAALATDPLTLTLPLAGDYDITIESTVSCAAGARGSLSYTVGATAASDEWACGVLQAVATEASVIKSHRQIGVTAGAVIAEQAKSSTGTSTFDNRSLSAVPVRVG